MYDLCAKVQMYDLRFEFLIDHGADEIIEAEIVLLLTLFVERSLGIRCTFELRLKTTAVLIKKGALLIGGCVGELIGIDEGCRALCRFAKMLQMSKFVSLRGSLLIITFAFLQIDFGVTLFGECSFGVMQMFLAGYESVLAIQSAGGQVDAR